MFSFETGRRASLYFPMLTNTAGQAATANWVSARVEKRGKVLRRDKVVFPRLPARVPRDARGRKLRADEAREKELRLNMLGARLIALCVLSLSW